MAARLHVLMMKLVRLAQDRPSLNLRGRVFWICPVLLVSSLSFAATNSELVDEIPPLRPPRAEIPATFLERYGVWIVVAAGVFLFIAGVGGLLFSRKNKTSPLPPEI